MFRLGHLDRQVTEGAAGPRRGTDVLRPVSRDSYEMDVIAREPAIHAQFVRKLATRLHPFFIACITSVSHVWRHTDRVHVGTRRRPRDKDVARPENRQAWPRP
jgi:hypothetical protein